MSMKRTIFEVPAGLQGPLLQTLSDYSLSFHCLAVPGSDMVEVAVTHSKSQGYLLDLVEDHINALAGDDQPGFLPN